MTREECHDFVYEKLHFCGCGDPESVLKYVADVLDALKGRSDSGWSEETKKKCDELLPDYGCEPRAAITLYLLDQAGLIEHGSGIGGSWLTQEGEKFLVAVKEYGVEAIMKAPWED